tara:strand:+ start:510 stop:716 length:207 start_codon:yes stop_codon:yes gene_type:complete
MYTTENFKTKKAMREAVKSGQQVEVFQPGGFFAGKTDGTITLEGPHYPAPHSWYATATIANSIIVSVK